MFEFKRKNDRRKQGAADPSIPTGQDLLAETEAKEFADSVIAAKERRMAAEQVAAAKGEIEGDRGAANHRSSVEAKDGDNTEQITWDELPDVFAPKVCSLANLDSRRLIECRSVAAPKANRSSYRFCCEIEDRIWKLMRAHLREDLENELGGLLVGTVSHDPDSNTFLVIVEDALRAPGGISSPTSFSYSSTSWEYLAPVLESLAKDRTIVGSYHSHPGMGVFLSSTDLDTQSSIFPYPWQIAVVIDPVREEFGVFVGPMGIKYAGSGKSNA